MIVALKIAPKLSNVQTLKKIQHIIKRKSTTLFYSQTLKGYDHDLDNKIFSDFNV